LSTEAGKQDEFDFRRVQVAPGVERPCKESEWQDSLVVVARGLIELEVAASAEERGTDRRVASLLLAKKDGEAVVVCACQRGGPNPQSSKR